MEIYAPDYYGDFVCIADKCRHSCCIGWEIDIDDNTLDYYSSVEGAFGTRLRENISQGDNPHFILGSDERCPFLNQNNLCDIYTELGKEHLCQICSDHPRFRNFFDGRTEIGLGMCCEAAARLILNRKEKMKLVKTHRDCEEAENDEENIFFNLRQKAFDIVQNREITVDERIEHLIREFDLNIPRSDFCEWTEYYLELEILEPQWKDLLESSRGLTPCPAPCFDEEKWQIAFEQLIVYFIFRHMAEGFFESNIDSRLVFAIHSFEMIKNLCSLRKDASVENLTEIARMYSAEIEYSEENTEDLIFELETGAM